MKKLKLKLNIDTMLSRDAMKKISGGYGDQDCLRFDCGTTCPTAPGWCLCGDLAGTQACWGWP